ncbi:hypothetical protein [Yeosuana marina]|uniref:hypothetical protein n=1 Tax=Yeosuana marina TaxID=1565536 RepID=UPI0030C85EF0
MPININIRDEDVEGFNDQAKFELTNSVTDFSNDLIAESNRIESSLNTSNTGPEITSSIVRDAKVLLRHKISKPKKSFGLLALKIGASISSLLVGILYDKDKLQEGWYLIIYIIAIALAILLTTLTIFKEES